jgi:molybdate transport system substrate-binding protein
MAEIIRELGRIYKEKAGLKVSAEFTRSPLVRDRVLADESFDVVITTQSHIDELVSAGKVAPDTGTAVARSQIGVAVGVGCHKPDISTVDAFIRALREANSIACADPAFGTPSGLYLERLFDRLGLAAELKPKIRFAGTTGGKPIMVCEAVANGQAELGIQQIAEIISVSGVDLVGPLPAELQHTTVFGVAVASIARNQTVARQFVVFLTSEAAKPIICAHGMQPFSNGDQSSA